MRSSISGGGDFVTLKAPSFNKIRRRSTSDPQTIQQESLRIHKVQQTSTRLVTWFGTRRPMAQNSTLPPFRAHLTLAKYFPVGCLSPLSHLPRVPWSILRRLANRLWESPRAHLCHTSCSPRVRGLGKGLYPRKCTMASRRWQIGVPALPSQFTIVSADTPSLSATSRWSNRRSKRFLRR